MIILDFSALAEVGAVSFGQYYLWVAVSSHIIFDFDIPAGFWGPSHHKCLS